MEPFVELWRHTAMRPVVLVLVLGIATLTFAGTTVYFARELAELQARSATPAANTLTTSAATPAQASPTHFAAPDAAPRAAQGQVSASVNASSNIGVPTQLTEADLKRMQADHSRHLLARLDEPQGREEMRAEHRIMFRNMYPRMDKFLGLTADQYEQMLNLMADQQIGSQEKQARCMVDPACDLQNAGYDGQSHAREVSDFLGAERAAKFESYKNTLGERESVVQLRSRLSDNSRMSEDSAERLITALAEERSAMHREAAASGNGMYSFGMGAGTLFAPAEGSFESRYEAAQRNSQRLRDRAAEFLNGEQLRTFNEMQDELLVSMRAQLRLKGNSFSTVTYAMPFGVASSDLVIVGETPGEPDPAN